MFHRYVQARDDRKFLQRYDFAAETAQFTSARAEALTFDGASDYLLQRLRLELPIAVDVVTLSDAT